MKKMIYLLMLSTLFVSCKKHILFDGPMTTESRDLSGFTEVDNSGSIDVFITQDSSFDVNVKAYAKALPYLETKISNGRLSIGYKHNINIIWNKWSDNSKVYIQMPKLTYLSNSGSGDISISGNFTSTGFDIHNSGSGDISATGSFVIGSSDIDNSGSGRISLPSGTVTNLSVKSTGSGNVDGINFIATNADVKITGSGNVKVYVTQTIHVTITGSGDVYYTGNPSNITTHITGSGNLIKQ